MRDPHLKMTQQSTAGSGCGNTVTLSKICKIESGEHLKKLGYDRSSIEDESKLAKLAKKSDSKTDRLAQWIEKNLFKDGELRDDERLLVFTEYKETLFYLEQRLKLLGFDKNTMRLLYGGMTSKEFESVKGDFEDATAPVRLLLATDAASEGINMQQECRWIIHYDIPWSPLACSSATDECLVTDRCEMCTFITSAATRKRT